MTIEEIRIVDVNGNTIKIVEIRTHIKGFQSREESQNSRSKAQGRCDGRQTSRTPIAPLHG